MKRYYRLLSLALMLMGVQIAQAQWIFLEPAWENKIPGDAVAIWSGGNVSSVGPGTPDDAPRSSNGFVLLASSIGQLTSPLGYSQAVEDLRAVAAKARLSAQPYRYTATSTNTAVLWNLVFPGGFDQQSGQKFPSNVSGATYLPSKMDEAECAVRALLRINPLDKEGWRLLLNLYYERMVPLEFSASLAVSSAEEGRLVGQNATLRELPALQLAQSYFHDASSIFVGLMGNPIDASLVEGTDATTMAVAPEIARLLDGYVRCLEGYARISYEVFQLRNSADFRDPAHLDSLPLSLLNDIDQVADEVTLRLLLVSPFQNLPTYTFSQVARVRSRVHDLNQLHRDIVQGGVSFLAGSVDDVSSDALSHYDKLETDYVPLFSPGSAPGNSSFDRALYYAKLFQQHALVLEPDELSDIRQVKQRNYDKRMADESLTAQYESELQSLCGVSIDPDGQGSPDIYFGALPPDLRQGIGDGFLTNNYSFQIGSIYQQWQARDQAQTSLNLAALDLANTFSQMTNAQYVAEKIAAGQQKIAALILTNGQQVAGLEINKGNINAELALQLARIAAQSAKKKAVSDSIFTAIKNIAEDPTHPFIALGESAISAAGNMADAYITASAAMGTGEAQANAARQLAEIDAQLAQISASERAAAQYETADETMLRLSEQLNNLRLQADSQKVRVRLAAQQLDQESAKLATMLARVAYLLREWSRLESLSSENPALSSDLIIERDAAMRRGLDSYLLAQKWAFVAALSFQYKNNSPYQSSKSWLAQILATRNSKDLGLVLDQLDSENQLLGNHYQQSATFRTPTLSIRNLLQANLSSDSGTNIVSYGPTICGTNNLASDQCWKDFLHRSVGTNSAGVPYLRIVFSTMVSNSRVSTNQVNPLFSCTEFGELIFSGSDANNNFYKGVQLNFDVVGLPTGSTPTVSVQLSQLGAGSVRRVGFGNTTVDPSLSLRLFHFGSYATVFDASLNSFSASPGTAAFEERSPANDTWELVVYRDAGPNNPSLVDNVDKISDIRLRIGTRGFTDQIAATLCHQ